MNDNKTNQQMEPSVEEFSEQVRIRRDKLSQLKESGHDPYLLTTFDVNATAKEINSQFEQLEGKTVVIAGRMMSRRIMGKASFCHIQDSTGRLQSYVRRDEVGRRRLCSF